jgi:plasmid maintenance system antidote protein VapI
MRTFVLFIGKKFCYYIENSIRRVTMRVEPGRCLLRQLLVERNKTNQWLAEQTGLSEQKISNYVTGQSKMGYANAVSIALTLGVHAEDLYEQTRVKIR